MTSYALDIRLTEQFITIGPVALVPRTSTTTDFERALGQANRLIALDEVVTLYIYDNLGIRFWSAQDKVTSLQIVLETKVKEVFPKHAFVGPFQYMGQLLIGPLSGEVLVAGQLPGFVQDTDSLQYNVKLYEAKTLSLTFAATINPHTNNVQTFSVG